MDTGHEEEGVRIIGADGAARTGLEAAGRPGVNADHLVIRCVATGLGPNGLVVQKRGSAWNLHEVLRFSTIIIG